MPSFDSIDIIQNQAAALYRADDHHAAALAWARARAAALTLGNQSAAWGAGVWEADSWRRAGQIRRALGMLLSLLSDIPPDAPAEERYMAQKKAFTIQLSLRPECARLRRLLAELDSLETKQIHPRQDRHYARGDLAFARGDWKEALRHFARGWQVGYLDGGGQVKHHFAWRAIECNLRLDNRDDAESWQNHLSLTDQSEWEDARARLKAANFLLALEAGDDARIVECLDNGCGGDHYELRGQLFMRRKLLGEMHDPADISHPTRKLAKLRRTEDVHKRYKQLLALVDYRLACIRFTAGLPAVDDLYYRRSDVIPKRLKVTDWTKFQRQLYRFHFSWRLLLCYARRIDTLLDCNWRIKEAESRFQRCQAIASTAKGADGTRFSRSMSRPK